MRLLMVEDDEGIASFVVKGFEQAGYAIDHVKDGETGLHMAEHTRYDALIIDIMLPKMDGLALIDRLRKKGITSPVLILSAKRSVDDKVRGFHTGGDDYLTKPFSFSELQVRIQALIRRTTSGESQSVLQAGDLQLDMLKREAVRGGEIIDLKPREFALLEYLMRNAGNVVTKNMILEHVWNYRFDPETNVVDVLVHRLRAKVDKDFETKLIHTIRGAGYVLKVD